MRQKLKAYYERFQTGQLSAVSEFYTQLGPDYKHKLLYLHDIELFCVRLWLALENSERVCIYSDYDTDAVTATGVMYHGLRQLGFSADRLSFYAPDRFTEGYGMNPEAIAELALKNDLIVSVDCGINSTQEAHTILELNQIGQAKCDLIITDHHHLHGEVPAALAVVNPRLSEVYATEPQKQTEGMAKLEHLLDFALDGGLNPQQAERAREWARQIVRPAREFATKPDMFLSSSVTGVGVAWFCIVWLGYFLEEME